MIFATTAINQKTFERLWFLFHIANTFRFSFLNPKTRHKLNNTLFEPCIEHINPSDQKLCLQHYAYYRRTSSLLLLQCEFYLYGLTITFLKQTKRVSRVLQLNKNTIQNVKITTTHKNTVYI